MPVIALVWMAGEKGARCMTPRISSGNSRKQIGICFLPFSLPVLCVQLPLPHAVDVVRDGSCHLWEAVLCEIRHPWDQAGAFWVAAES